MKTKKNLSYFGLIDCLTPTFVEKPENLPPNHHQQLLISTSTICIIITNSWLISPNASSYLYLSHEATKYKTHTFRTLYAATRHKTHIYSLHATIRHKSYTCNLHTIIKYKTFNYSLYCTYILKLFICKPVIYSNDYH